METLFRHFYGTPRHHRAQIIFSSAAVDAVCRHQAHLRLTVDFDDFLKWKQREIPKKCFLFLLETTFTFFIALLTWLMLSGGTAAPAGTTTTTESKLATFSPSSKTLASWTKRWEERKTWTNHTSTSFLSFDMYCTVLVWDWPSVSILPVSPARDLLLQK